MEVPPGEEADVRRWEVDVVVADGGTIHVRPIRTTDLDGLRVFHRSLSPEAIYFRFFTPMPQLSDELVARLVNVDYHDRMALVAEVGEQIVGVARYERLDPERAEVAFVISDAHQGRGLGTLLLEHLAVIARSNGFVRFEAQTLADNVAMLRVFRNAGYEVARRFDGGVVEVAFAIEPTQRTIDLVDERDRHAVAASVHRLTHPASIAVFGAHGGCGRTVLRNLLAGGFHGSVFPVDPAGGNVDGVHVYAELGAVPIRVDLAVVAVPVDELPAVVEHCAAGGVGSLLIVGDGDAAAIDLARRNGMRVIGPSSVGVVNTADAVRLRATVTAGAPAAGRFGFMSQSGALSEVVFDETHARGVGLSCFVDAGDKLDVSGNDVLQYFEVDPSTEVIGLYLESFGNPRRFTRIARRVARVKPLVVVKAGRRAGVRRDESYAAALAPPAVVADAVLRSTGVTRVDSLDQLFDVATAFASQPLPNGRRVAIVGTLRGPATLAADAADAAGLEVVAFVDVPVDADAAALARSVRSTATDDSVDAVLVIHPATACSVDQLLDGLDAAAEAAAKPILASLLGPRGRGTMARGAVPIYRAPEAAARALAALADRADWLREPPGTRRADDPADIDRVKTIVEAFLGSTPAGGWLPPAQAVEFARAAGLPVLDGRLVDDPAGARAAAEALGYPVVVKSASPAITDRMAVGGIALALADGAAVERAATEILGRLGERAGGLLVQPMLPPGLDLIAGITTDEAFGPLVVFGLGGIRAELLLDRTVHPVPVTDEDAARMLRGLRTSPLLFGFRGAPQPDPDALGALLERLGRLAEEVPELTELDLNPIVAAPAQTLAVDFRVRIEPYLAHPEHSLRSLTMR